MNTVINRIEVFEWLFGMERLELDVPAVHTFLKKRFSLTRAEMNLECWMGRFGESCWKSVDCSHSLFGL